jgi:hypothetical protein
MHTLHGTSTAAIEFKPAVPPLLTAGAVACHLCCVDAGASNSSLLLPHAGGIRELANSSMFSVQTILHCLHAIYGLTSTAKHTPALC